MLYPVSETYGTTKKMSLLFLVFNHPNEMKLVVDDASCESWIGEKRKPHHLLAQSIVVDVCTLHAYIIRHECHTATHQPWPTAPRTFLSSHILLAVNYAVKQQSAYSHFFVGS